MRITYFNPAAEKITDFPAIDAVGMYCKDVFKNKICETDCALKIVTSCADGARAAIYAAEFIQLKQYTANGHNLNFP